MKTKRRSLKQKIKHRKTKRGGSSILPKGVYEKARTAAVNAAVSAVNLGVGVVNVGTATLGTGSNVLQSGEIIIKSVGLTSINLSKAVSGTLVGTSFTINQAIRGFFGLNLLICKSILVSSKLADLILNNIIRLLSEDEILLSKIRSDCNDILNKAGTEQLTLLTTNQCMSKYIIFLKKIYNRYLKTCLDMRKRMLKRIKNIFLLIKLKMIQIGCKRYWFSNKYTCREKTEGTKYFFFQKTKSMTTLNTINEKIVDIGKDYHTLNSQYRRTIQTIFDANVEPCKDSYLALLNELERYTGNHPGNYAYGKIRGFKSRFSESEFELQLRETLASVVNFLDVLNAHISEKETKDYLAEMEKRQKNKNDIEMKKIESEQNEKQAQFDKMVHDVEEIPNNEKKLAELAELDSTVDNKLTSQSSKLEEEFKKQYNENSLGEAEYKERNENSSVNRLNAQANNVNSGDNINRLYNSPPAPGAAST